MPSLKSTRVVCRDGVRPARVRFENGQIVAIDSGVADHDFGDLPVLPGLVDTHVHINEPGRAHWEGFATATRAAAAGGTTTLVDMPLNSMPPTVDLDALDAKRKAARGQLTVDIALWGGILPGSARNIAQMSEAGVCGFKVFLVDSGVPEYPPIGLEDVDGILTNLELAGVPLLAHAERENLLRPIAGEPRSYVSYLKSRPPESESMAIRDLALKAGDTSTRVHILHVSSQQGVAEIAAGPGNLTGETCPHYLTFAAEDIPDGATLFKCTPPIRETEHREQLWSALAEGTLSMIVSDHSPAPPEIKEAGGGDFSKAWGGISSLQLRLPAVWTQASRRGHGMVQLAEWLATAPAGLAGLNTKGSIDVGMDADFTVFDPEARFIADSFRLEHRHPISPYDGMTLRGEVQATFLAGQPIYLRDGSVRRNMGRLINRD